MTSIRQRLGAKGCEFMKDYSQSGEQKIILEHFGSFVGTFASIGENDGQTFSNVRALTLLGWKGVCVEPAEIAYSKLKLLYSDLLLVPMPPDFNGTVDEFFDTITKNALVNKSSRVVCVNAAITTEDGPIDFYDSGTHLNKGDTSLLSTTKPDELDRWKKSGEVFTKTTVRGITWKTMMEESGCSKFDFISVDCEGADWDVVSQIDLTAVGCKMICLEVNSKYGHLFRFKEYTESHNMRLLYAGYENRIYVSK